MPTANPNPASGDRTAVAEKIAARLPTDRSADEGGAVLLGLSMEEWSVVLAALRPAPGEAVQGEDGGDLSAAVERMVREQLTGAGIEVQLVTVGEVRDGVLGLYRDIVIWCVGTPKEIARAEPLGFITGIRNLFAEHGQEAFPLIAFRSDPPRSTERRAADTTGGGDA